jgi:uncharacterized repeat protein (TIGR01451 family)
MQHKLRTEVQLILVLILAMASMAGLSFVLGSAMPSMAQGPITATPPRLVITGEDLTAFGIAPGQIEAAAASNFDLGVVKSTNVTTVPAGTVVTFNVTITNHGPDPAIGVVFQDFTPDQMINVTYAFESANVISNGASTASNLKWYFYDTIPNGGSTVVTVTGELTSALSITVTNTAAITTVNPSYESGSNANSDSVDVGIGGYNPALSGLILYLPFVAKFPTPTPAPVVQVYYQNFDSGEPWFENLGSNCSANHTNGIYQVDVDGDNRECLPPANGSPSVTYGEWEVEGYISGEDQDSNHAYGLWFNGAGGDTQYVFRIYPNVNGCSNGGKWEFLRRKPNANSTLQSNNCDTNIKRGYGSGSKQTIRAAHKSNGEIRLYIDDNLITPAFIDTNQITNGNASGVYTRAGDTNEQPYARIKFDEYRIFRYP